MEKEVKNDIIKMLMPIIGIWWLIINYVKGKYFKATAIFE